MSVSFPSKKMQSSVHSNALNTSQMLPKKRKV